MRLFAVIRSRGPAWNAERPLDGQDEWPAHAAFMNALHRDGFVLLGGPLEGTPEVLLIAHARDADEIRSRLSADAWTRNGLLRIERIVPWTLRLGVPGSGLAFRHFSPPMSHGAPGMSECKT